MIDEPNSSNNLLNALREDDRKALLPLLRLVNLPAGARLYEPGDSIEQCYFPCGSAIASFYVVMEDGRAIETAMVGREGALGGVVSNGRLPAFARATVLHAGTFLKTSLAELDRIKDERPSVERLFNRYADCFMAQVFQTVACNAAHSIEQRAARWLLASRERTSANHFQLTQEQLGGLLGVGRAYVGKILAKLRSEGLVVTRRGEIEVLDEARLIQTACDCNDLIRAHFDEVLRGVYPE
jgi:CRP-like cAMP-binding protein